jgi:hypothetical protein
VGSSFCPPRWDAGEVSTLAQPVSITGEGSSVSSSNGEDRTHRRSRPRFESVRDGQHARLMQLADMAGSNPASSRFESGAAHHSRAYP